MRFCGLWKNRQKNYYEKDAAFFAYFSMRFEPLTDKIPALFLRLYQSN